MSVPQWASPGQFNHAIIAVKVSDAITLPTVIADSSLGRLLVFDPTDSITPVGSLPTEEQGSYALVIAPNGGALLKMPLLPASANRIEAAVAATMNANGGIDASLQRQYFGQSGIPLRAVDKLRGHEELQKRFERGFTHGWVQSPSRASPPREARMTGWRCTSISRRNALDK